MQIESNSTSFNAINNTAGVTPSTAKTAEETTLNQEKIGLLNQDSESELQDASSIYEQLDELEADIAQMESDKQAAIEDHDRIGEYINDLIANNAPEEEIMQAEKDYDDAEKTINEIDEALAEAYEVLPDIEADAANAPH